MYSWFKSAKVGNNGFFIGFLSTLFCCCIGWIFCIYEFQKYYKNKDYDNAKGIIVGALVAIGIGILGYFYQNWYSDILSKKNLQQTPVAVQKVSNESNTSNHETNNNDLNRNNSSTEEQINELCKRLLGDRFVETSIKDKMSGEPNTEGTKVVFVYAKVPENFTAKMMKTSFLEDMRKVMGGLYQADLHVSSITYFGKAKTIDKNGKEEESNVGFGKLKKATADKIDWSNIKDMPLDNFEKLLDGKDTNLFDEE